MSAIYKPLILNTVGMHHKEYMGACLADVTTHLSFTFAIYFVTYIYK